MPFIPCQVKVPVQKPYGKVVDPNFKNAIIRNKNMLRIYSENLTFEKECVDSEHAIRTKEKLCILQFIDLMNLLPNTKVYKKCIKLLDARQFKVGRYT